MYFIDDVNELATRIGNQEVLLCNVGQCWVYICSAEQMKLPEKLDSIHRPLDNPAMLLVSSIEMFKKYVPELHPRVETLLSFHNRPLGLHFEDSVGPFQGFIDNNIHIVRQVKDPLLRSIINTIDAPLLLLDVITAQGMRPKSLSEINSELLDLCDHTLKYRREERLKGIPCILASYNKKGELEFIRE